jgi:hypothetical protein
VFIRIWESNISFLNQEEHLMLILVEKWWNSNKHLIKKNTKSPNIYCKIMALSF